MPDPRGYLLPAERQILLRRYAPVLVLFPELPNHAPYPDDGDSIYTVRGSYHPRSAELFLQHARVRYRRRELLRHPGLLFKSRSLHEEYDQIKDAIDAEALRQAVEKHAQDPRYTGLGDAELRAALLRHLIQEQLAQRVRGLDLPRYRGFNLAHWRAYFTYLAQADPETRRSVVYGRLMQGLAPLGIEQAPPQSSLVQTSQYGPYDVSQTSVALQYWFHYYYDDWANRHEGDWESITLLLELSPEIVRTRRELREDELLAGVTVGDVGYSSHEDGYRRLWPDVQKTAEGRPIVYVARGSQASYFGWQLNGYPTSARVGFVEKVLSALGGLFRGKRFLGRRWDGEFRARFTGRDPKNTDWVPVDPQAGDRLDGTPIDALEQMVPPGCRGVRRTPSFSPYAGQDQQTYYLETEDLFWLELVQEFGVQWGEDFFLPGSRGPVGISKAERDEQRRFINALAQIEEAITDALSQMMDSQIATASALPELNQALKPLRPNLLSRRKQLPPAIRPYLYQMWAALLRSHPEAWPGGPNLRLRWIFRRQPKPGPLLDRDDPIYHLKSLLAQVRRTRYEEQHISSKWDNPFAWVRYICRADTFFYGVPPAAETQLDMSRLDCSDVEMTIT
ncbi:MAG: hypothetical protein GXY36_06370 [Chloroflexi bacterium]|nr:hypothetical protein [Chloroflexota bacterium]